MKEIDYELENENVYFDKPVELIDKTKEEWEPMVSRVFELTKTLMGNGETATGSEATKICLALAEKKSTAEIRDTLKQFGAFLLKKGDDNKTNFETLLEKANPGELYSLIYNLNEHFGLDFDLETMGKLAPEDKAKFDQIKKDKDSKTELYNKLYKYNFGANYKLSKTFGTNDFSKQNYFGGKGGAISFDRTGGHSVAMLMLLAEKDLSGKYIYSVDDMYDNSKLLDKKQNAFNTVLQKSIKAGPAEKADNPKNKDAVWLVDNIFEGIMAGVDRLNELAEKLEVNQDNLMQSEDFIKICSLGYCITDAWQEIWRYKGLCEEKLKKEFPNINSKGKRNEFFSKLTGLFGNVFEDLQTVAVQHKNYVDGGNVKYEKYIPSTVNLSYFAVKLKQWKENGKGLVFSEYYVKNNIAEKYLFMADKSNETTADLCRFFPEKKLGAITDQRIMDGSLTKGIVFDDSAKDKSKFQVKNFPKQAKGKNDYEFSEEFKAECKRKDAEKKARNAKLKKNHKNNLTDNIIDNKAVKNNISEPRNKSAKSNQIDLREVESYLQALKQVAGEARGMFHDSDEYISFYMAIDDVADEVRALRNLKKNKNKIINEEDIYKGYKKAVRNLKACAKAYEDYKLSDHTEHPLAEPRKLEVNSDDRRKLKIVRSVLNGNRYFSFVRTGYSEIKEENKAQDKIVNTIEENKIIEEKIEDQIDNNIKDKNENLVENKIVIKDDIKIEEKNDKISDNIIKEKDNTDVQIDDLADEEEVPIINIEVNKDKKENPNKINILEDNKTENKIENKINDNILNNTINENKIIEDISDEEFLKRTDEAMLRLKAGKYTSGEEFVEDAAYAMIGQMFRFGGNKELIDSKTGKKISLWNYMQDKLASGEFEKSIKSTSEPDKFVSPGKILEMIQDEKKVKGQINNISKNGVNSGKNTMLKSFVSDMNKLLQKIRDTYTVDKSSPEKLMKNLVDSINGAVKGIDNVSLEEFATRLNVIDSSVDAYLEGTSYSNKMNKIERRDAVQTLKDMVAEYRGETKRIKAGKEGDIHNPHLADKTEGNGITTVDIKKNLLAFIKGNVEKRIEVLSLLTECDPDCKKYIKGFFSNEITKKPNKDLKNVIDAAKEWYLVGEAEFSGKRQDLSFDKIKNMMENLNKKALIYMANCKDKNSVVYDYVSGIQLTVQNELRNIRLLQPYIDLETPEGKMTDKNIFDVVKNMEEPYNKLVALSDEMAIDRYGKNAATAQVAFVGALKKEKNLYQVKYENGKKLRRSLLNNQAANRMVRDYQKPEKSKASENDKSGRLKAFSKIAVTQLFMKELDAYDGWAEFAENNKSNDIVNVIGRELRLKLVNNKAFLNVYKKVAIDDIGEALLKESKRLGTEKEIKDLVKPANIAKAVNEWNKKNEKKSTMIK